MKILSKTVFLVVILAASFSHTEGRRGGSWDFALDLVNHTKEQLISGIENADSQKMIDVIKNHSGDLKVTDVDKKYLTNVISRLALMEGEDSLGRMLVNSEDANGPYLIAYTKFAVMYGQLPYEQTSVAFRREIKRKIIHEVSHTWGLGVENDELSIAFSNDFLTNVLGEPNYLIANPIKEATLKDQDICTRTVYHAESVTFYNPTCRGVSLIARTGWEEYRRSEGKLTPEVLANLEMEKADLLCKYLGFSRGMYVGVRLVQWNEELKLGVQIIQGQPRQSDEHTYIDKGWFSKAPYYGNWLSAFTCWK